MSAEKEKADIKSIELLVASSWTSKDGAKAIKIRLVQWIINGEAKSVKLEKRNFFRTDGGEMRMGKADGFTRKDLEALKPHWKNIIDLMEHPPMIQKEETAAGAGGSDDPGF